MEACFRGVGGKQYGLDLGVDARVDGDVEGFNRVKALAKGMSRAREALWGREGAWRREDKGRRMEIRRVRGSAREAAAQQESKACKGEERRTKVNGWQYSILGLPSEPTGLTSNRSRQEAVEADRWKEKKEHSG
jgi:hypothetical protein